MGPPQMEENGLNSDALNIVPDFMCLSENPTATGNYSPPIDTSDPVAGYEVCDLNVSRMDTYMSLDDDAINMEVNEVSGKIGHPLNDFVAKEAIVPVVGMKFGTVDELYEFYKSYAHRVGFPVRRRSSWKGKDDGVVRGVKFTCGREGSRKSGSKDPLEPQPTMKIGCKAKLTAVTDANGIWQINTVFLEHNHENSPTKSRMFKCNRVLNDGTKRQLVINDVAGIPVHKSFQSTVVEAGGYENMTFTEKDCRNYIEEMRRLRLGEGDAATILSYFTKMQTKCPGFYFSIEVDREDRLKNVFWADSRSRLAYKEFGDVITFDTTYLTNKYDMPFAPFVGVNHHGETTLLGCGLICSEDADTFRWLFKTWLECMEDKAPVGIITDQDKAMKIEISKVFPDTKHRWCLWHIMKKIPEKFGYHTEKEKVMQSMKVVVHDSQTPEEFESGWGHMVEKYSLQDNDWLAHLYVERQRWVPCFLKCSFWAGMSTTQRSESVNAFFDGYVNSKTSLKLFIEQYERALRNKVEKEFVSDFKSYSQMVPCVTIYEIEKQFQSIYTLRKFRELQDEVTGKMYCEIISIEDMQEGGVQEWTRYVVQEDFKVNEVRRQRKVTVFFKKEDCHISCTCLLFEFRGIICRHAITILIKSGVKEVPDRYILRRWRKDVIRLYKNVKTNYDGLESTPAQLRYEELCRDFSNVAAVAAEEEKSYREMKKWIVAQSCDSTIPKSKPSCGSNLLSRNSGVLDSDCTGEVEHASVSRILDPKCSKRKGAPSKNRKPGPLEKKTKRSKCSHVTNEQTSATPSSVVHGQTFIPPAVPASSTVPHGQAFIQPPMEMQYPVFPPGYFSQQLMGAHYQQWRPTGIMNSVPTFSTDQLNNGALNFVPTFSTDQHNIPTYGPHGTREK